MMQAAEGSHIYSSPSFSSYSSETLAEIAARVIEELRIDPHSLSDDALFTSWETQDFLDQGDCPNDLDGGVADDNDDFEFAFVSREPESSPVSADDIFYNGQIKPMYPTFDRNLLFSDHSDFAPRNESVVSPTAEETAPSPVRQHRLPLRKLMSEERETGSFSSSTSEADDDDLDSLAPGTYCVWSPKSAAKPCKKSNSTGSTSKRWKLRNLLLRSHSEGGKEQGVLFLTPSKRTNKVANDISNTKSGEKSTSTDKNGINHTKSRGIAAAKDGDPTNKRKSFLPYRHELVGLFNNVNGLGRNLHPF